jgi:hypothetical protein
MDASVALITTLGAIAVALISGGFAFATQRGKGSGDYLRERIAVLEAREDTTLAPLVAAVQSQQDSIAQIAQLVTTVMDEIQYRRRRQQEGSDD